MTSRSFHSLLLLGFLAVATTSAIPPKAPPPTGTRAPGLQPDLVRRGTEVFERNCVVCHGPRGDGRGELATVTFPRPRDFTRGIFKYRSTASGTLPTDDDLEGTIRSGLTGTAMPAFVQLRNAEVRAVVEFVKSLSGRWKDGALARSVTQPAAPDWLADEDEAAGRATRGRRIFLQACAPCHGQRGDGQGASAPEMTDTWGQPCPPRSLRDAGLRRGAAPETLFLTLLTGLDGTPMPSFAEALDPDQLWDVIAYVLELRAP